MRKLSAATGTAKLFGGSVVATALLLKFSTAPVTVFSIFARQDL
jgi:acyl-CoA thioesterase